MDNPIVKRSAGVDLLRVIGLVAVVVGHVYVEQTRSALYLWHVPLFFFLAGWFWTDGRSIRSELVTRSRTLLIPYAAWLVAVGTLVLVLPEPGPDPLRMALGGVHVGRPFSAFWFVTALAGAAVLLRALERFPRWVAWVVAIAALCTTGALPGAVAGVPLSLGIAVGAMGFLLAGRSARRWTPIVLGTCGRWAPLLIVAVLTMVGTLVATGIARPLDLKNGDLGTPVVSVVAATLVCWSLTALFSAAVHVTGPIGRIATALATTGTGVVLTHAVVLWVLDTPTTGRALDLVLALAVPFAAAVVIRATPLSRALLGIRPTVS